MPTDSLTKKQKALYEPPKTWLESQGFHAMVTGAGMQFVIPISDLFSGPYKVPDIVGVDESGRVVIAEVDKEKAVNKLLRGS